MQKRTSPGRNNGGGTAGGGGIAEEDKDLSLTLNQYPGAGNGIGDIEGTGICFGTPILLNSLAGNYSQEGDAEEEDEGEEVEDTQEEDANPYSSQRYQKRV